MFAKLFNTKDFGQILIKIDDGENGAEVRVYFEPDGLGVCSIAFSWEDDSDDEQWNKAEKIFDGLCEESVSKLVEDTLNGIKK